MTIRELSLEILKITNVAGWLKIYDLEQGRLELLLEKEVKNTWNEAIKTSLLNAEISEDGMYVNPESILKLLK